MEKESSFGFSSSPLRNNEKVQARYLSPHTSSRHDFCKHGKNLEVEPEANSLNPKQTVKKTKKLSQPAVSNKITLLDSPKFPDHIKIHQPGKYQEKHEYSDNEYPKIKIAQENTNSSVKKIVSQLSKATPVKEVAPHASGEGKASNASKIRLMKSSSRNRSLRNSSIQRKHVKETKDIPEASEVSETESENGQEIGEKSKKTENNISSSSIKRVKSIKRTTLSANRIVLSLQLKKLRSIKRTTTHEYVLSYPLKEVNSTNKNVSLLESPSSPRLTKAKSSKKNASTHVEVKSNKQNAEALERDSSLEATKLKSISESKASNDQSDKKKSSKNESISNMVSRKFMSIMRNSSAKNKNKEVKTDIEPNAEEESLCEVNAKLELPRSRTTREEENGTGTLKIRRATVINRSKSVSGGRRLWFNIGKAANSESGSVANGLTRKRSVRIKRGGFSSKDELQSVVLKHQKTMKKNDMETLFNEVIEKTASKLRGSKKSKVKALVGAFENVISIQGGKPVSAV